MLEKGRPMRLVSARLALLAVGLGTAVLVCACDSVHFSVVVSMPPAPVHVTDGDYILSGGVSAHIADQTGLCGVYTAHGVNIFRAMMPTDDGTTGSYVTLTVAPHNLAADLQASGSGTYSSEPPPFTGTFGPSQAVLMVQVGRTLTVTGAQLDNLDPKARTFVSRSLSVTLNADSTGTVTATLGEVTASAAANGLVATFSPIPNAPTVKLQGTFSCVASDS